MEQITDRFDTPIYPGAWIAHAPNGVMVIYKVLRIDEKQRLVCYRLFYRASDDTPFLDPHEVRIINWRDSIVLGLIPPALTELDERSKNA